MNITSHSHTGEMTCLGSIAHLIQLIALSRRYQLVVMSASPDCSMHIHHRWFCVCHCCPASNHQSINQSTIQCTYFCLEDSSGESDNIWDSSAAHVMNVATIGHKITHVFLVVLVIRIFPLCFCTTLLKTCIALFCACIWPTHCCKCNRLECAIRQAALIS